MANGVGNFHTSHAATAVENLSLKISFRRNYKGTDAGCIAVFRFSRGLDMTRPGSQRGMKIWSRGQLGGFAAGCVGRVTPEIHKRIGHPESRRLVLQNAIMSARSGFEPHTAPVPGDAERFPRAVVRAQCVQAPVRIANDSNFAFGADHDRELALFACALAGRSEDFFRIPKKRTHKMLIVS
jgi:hypothetical protein